MNQAPTATNCPDWRALAARRDLDETGERLWDAALEHFDACSRCREAACEAEPTLIFRRLPAPRVEAAEIDAVRQAVHAMRRGRALEDTPHEPPARRSRPRRSRPRRSVALAAALVAALGGALLLQGGAGAPEAPSTLAMNAPTMNAPTMNAPTMNAPTTYAPAAALTGLDLEGLPLVEDLDPAHGTLIELHGDEVSIVMVVADNQEGFDV